MAVPTQKHDAAHIRTLEPQDPDRAAALACMVDGTTTRLSPSSSVRARRNVDALLRAVEAQRLKLDLVFGAWRRGHLVAAAGVIESPGGTAMSLLGVRGSASSYHDAGVSLLTHALEPAWERGCVLMQSLLAPEDTHLAAIHADAGFEFLAELAYLECPLSGHSAQIHRLRGITYLTYSPDLESLFVAALEGSYHESLDCPKLNGVRTTSDVLLGHRHTGLSDPANLWFVALRGEKPVGVLLLSGVLDRSCVEIAYVGVVAGSRGCGLGDALLSLAVDVARRRGADSLICAVDATNRFARSLYARWGFVDVGRRRAWICRRPC